MCLAERRTRITVNGGKDKTIAIGMLEPGGKVKAGLGCEGSNKTPRSIVWIPSRLERNSIETSCGATRACVSRMVRNEFGTFSVRMAC